MDVVSVSLLYPAECTVYDVCGVAYKERGGILLQVLWRASANIQEREIFPVSEQYHKTVRLKTHEVLLRLFPEQ